MSSWFVFLTDGSFYLTAVPRMPFRAEVISIDLIEITLVFLSRNHDFATLKLPFWDIDFKLVIKKQSTQKEYLTHSLFSARKTCSRKEI